MFGLGILYTILFPLIVVIFAAYLVYVFFNYLVLELVAIFGFFFGYTFTAETELEEKLHELKDEKKKEKDEEIKYEYSPSVEEEIIEEGSEQQ